MEGKAKSRKRLIVIGGGAAGFFCAVNAAEMNPLLEVIIVEKSSKLLSKVRISGGGRCNLTHACFEMDEMIRRYPRGKQFLRKAFHQFFTTDTIEWFRQRGVLTKTEQDGRMFPQSNSSQSVIDCLLREANKYAIQILMNRDVQSITPLADTYELKFSNGESMQADFVCIACGGFPKTSMFDWITALGHTIEEPVPSLFTFNMPGNKIVELMGLVADNAAVKIPGTKLQEQGPLLITHWGLSGPVILRLSAWGARDLAAIAWKFRVMINWVAEHTDITAREKIQSLRFEKASVKLSAKNDWSLPARLWEFLLRESAINPETRWSDLPSKEANRLVKNLCGWEAEVNGKTTFKEEFVTAGGIRLSEVDPNSMMSKKLKNLFFVGEILDVDGITGGFNFQHAWTSGFIAAKTISQIE